MPDELPSEELPPSPVGVQHTFVDQSSFMPQLVNSDGEIMKFNPMHCNDVVTRKSEQSVDDLSVVTSTYPIGTVKIIMSSVTQGNLFLLQTIQIKMVLVPTAMLKTVL